MVSAFQQAIAEGAVDITGSPGISAPSGFRAIAKPRPISTFGSEDARSKAIEKAKRTGRFPAAQFITTTIASTKGEFVPSLGPGRLAPASVVGLRKAGIIAAPGTIAGRPADTPVETRAQVSARQAQARAIQVKAPTPGKVRAVELAKARKVFAQGKGPVAPKKIFVAPPRKTDIERAREVFAKGRGPVKPTPIVFAPLPKTDIEKAREFFADGKGPVARFRKPEEPKPDALKFVFGERGTEQRGIPFTGREGTFQRVQETFFGTQKGVAEFGEEQFGQPGRVVGAFVGSGVGGALGIFEATFGTASLALGAGAEQILGSEFKVVTPIVLSEGFKEKVPGVKFLREKEILTFDDKGRIVVTEKTIGAGAGLIPDLLLLGTAGVAKTTRFSKVAKPAKKGKAVSAAKKVKLTTKPLRIGRVEEFLKPVGRALETRFGIEAKQFIGKGKLRADIFKEQIAKKVKVGELKGTVFDIREGLVKKIKGPTITKREEKDILKQLTKELEGEKALRVKPLKVKTPQETLKIGVKGKIKPSEQVKEFFKPISKATKQRLGFETREFFGRKEFKFDIFKEEVVRKSRIKELKEGVVDIRGGLVKKIKGPTITKREEQDILRKLLRQQTGEKAIRIKPVKIIKPEETLIIGIKDKTSVKVKGFFEPIGKAAKQRLGFETKEFFGRSKFRLKELKPVKFDEFVEDFSRGIRTEKVSFKQFVDVGETKAKTSFFRFRETSIFDPVRKVKRGVQEFKLSTIISAEEKRAGLIKKIKGPTITKREEQDILRKLLRQQEGEKLLVELPKIKKLEDLVLTIGTRDKLKASERIKGFFEPIGKATKQRLSFEKKEFIGRRKLLAEDEVKLTFIESTIFDPVGLKFIKKPISKFAKETKAATILDPVGVGFIKKEAKKGISKIAKDVREVTILDPVGLKGIIIETKKERDALAKFIRGSELTKRQEKAVFQELIKSREPRITTTEDIIKRLEKGKPKIKPVKGKGVVQIQKQPVITEAAVITERPIIAFTPRRVVLQEEFVEQAPAFDPLGTTTQLSALQVLTPAFVSKQDKLFRQRIKVKPDERFGTFDVQKSLDKFKIKEKQKLGLGQEFRLGEKFKEGEAFRLGVSFRLGEKLREGELFKLGEKFIAGEKLRTGQTFKIPPIFGVPPLLPEVRLKQRTGTEPRFVKGFNVFVKEEPFKKSKFLKVNEKPLPESNAREFAQQIVDNTIAQTFEVRPTKKLVKRGTRPFFTLDFKFREQKKSVKGGKPIQGKRFIEFRQFAIDSIGELNKLKVSAFLARRKKTKQQSFLGVKL